MPTRGNKTHRQQRNARDGSPRVLPPQTPGTPVVDQLQQSASTSGHASQQSTSASGLSPQPEQEPSPTASQSEPPSAPTPSPITAKQSRFLLDFLTLTDALEEEHRKLTKIPAEKRNILTSLTRQMRDYILDRAVQYEGMKGRYEELRSTVETRLDTLPALLQEAPSTSIPTFPSRRTYATALNSQLDDSDALILKPSGPTSTLDDIRKNLRALENLTEQITDVRPTRSGSLIVKCATAEDLTSFKTKLESAPVLSESVAVVYRGPRRQRLIIFNLPEGTTKEQVLSSITSSSPGFRIADIHFVRQLTGRNGSYHQVVDVPASQAALLLSPGSGVGRLVVNFANCLLKTYVTMIRCYHCQELNHHAARCPSLNKNPICSHCAGEHKSCDPQSPNSPCCANCFDSNRRRGTNYDPNHPAYSRVCPYYLDELSRLRDRMDRQSRS